MNTFLRLMLLAFLTLGFVGASSVEVASAQAPAPEPEPLKVVQTPSAGAYAAWGGLYVSNFCITPEGGCWVTFNNEEFLMQWPDGEARGKVVPGKGKEGPHIEADWKGTSGNTGKIMLYFIQAKGQLMGSWGYMGSYNSGGDITFGRPKTR